ncbi:hypothetical protein EC396_02920 [Lutibacter sp. HS1-25]|uniref:sulfatase-like hydrolase/transferase n=1 Tax=Lutibacter sp. HS1-25 TaxID=2485000 RepID=UPI0010114723|nr:sulfatase-like hydrolase/transferase [Lutibacter sp. HS1-25]RXP62686.1 hypothetical protein EC396_02920 [Lutibacter sp. HS1-25]
MIKKLFILILAFLSIVSCKKAPKETSIPKDLSKPNIVFIFSDDLSFRDISAYGQKNYTTPRIDGLIEQSIRFTQAYAGAPECAPSRGTLLTGKHVGHQVIRLNSSARGFEPLPENTNTFAKMLQQAGYKTGVVGKWGLGYSDTSGNPLKQGFDYHFGFLTHYEAHSYFPLVLYENNKEIYYPQNDSFDIEQMYSKNEYGDNSKFEKHYNEDGKLIYMDMEKAAYAPDLFDKKASEFITTNKNNPFLLYFTTNLPHGPTIVDDFRQLKDRNDVDIYAREWGAMVQRLDISVGKIIDKLKEEGIYDNTMIVFASDNGYSMHSPKTVKSGERVWLDDKDLANKGPFKGGKFGVFEGGMRIPFFIRMPHQNEAKIISEPVWLVDLFPTFASVVQYPLDEKLDGFNLLPLMAGDKNAIPSNRFMYFYKQNEQAIRQGPWFAYREHPNKEVELYLIEEDQEIKFNYASVYPKKVEELKQLMDSEHIPSEWYWNPGDTQEIFKNKVKKAKETGQEIKKYRPNKMELMPWEKSK